jgi:hypothetical protein
MSYKKTWADDMVKLRSALNENQELKSQKELYRLFIVETGRRDEFLAWAAKRNGMSEETLKALNLIGGGRHG